VCQLGLLTRSYLPQTRRPLSLRTCPHLGQAEMTAADIVAVPRIANWQAPNLKDLSETQSCWYIDDHEVFDCFGHSVSERSL
jgi:hypothetical protein